MTNLRDDSQETVQIQSHVKICLQSPVPILCLFLQSPSSTLLSTDFKSLFVKDVPIKFRNPMLNLIQYLTYYLSNKSNYPGQTIKGGLPH